MQITINVPDTIPPEFLQLRIQEIEESLKMDAKKLALPQPEVTQGDKNIDINDLFGIWEKHPKDLTQIRKQAWQRSGLG